MRLGRVRISTELVREWLQFPSAEIVQAEFDMEHDCLDITLKDVEMPEVEAGSSIPYVTLSFRRYYAKNGLTVDIREPVEGYWETP